MTGHPVAKTYEFSFTHAQVSHLIDLLALGDEHMPNEGRNRRIAIRAKVLAALGRSATELTRDQSRREEEGTDG